MAEYDDDDPGKPDEKESDAERKKELLETAKKRKDSSDTYWDDVKRLGVEDHKFAIGNADNGYQWDQDIKFQRQPPGMPGRPCLTINRIPAHIAQVTNEQRQNRPQIKVRAVNDEGDPEVAEIINGIVRHAHNNVSEIYEGGDVSITTASEHQVRSGIGYVQICIDYCDDESLDQDIYFRRISDWTSISDDPMITTLTGRDRKFLFESYMMDEEAFDSEYPEAEAIDWESSDVADADWFDRGSKKVRVAKYWYVEEKRKKLKVGGKSRMVKECHVKCAILSGTEVLEEYDFPGKYIPYARVVGNESLIDGKPEISGLTRGGKDAQKMFNYGRSAQAEHIGLAPKAPFITPAEAIAGYEDVWNKANAQAFSALPYNAYNADGQPLPMPQRAQPTMPNSALSEMVGQSADDIKATFGQYDASMGARSNETSGRAIVARQKEGDTATYHYLDNLAHAVKFCGDIIVGVIPEVYDTKRIARILGDDDTEDYALINPSQKKAIEHVTQADGSKRKSYNLSVGRYDVVVTVGPSYASKRQEGLAFLTEAGAKIPEMLAANMDLLAKMSDQPYADEMAKRLKTMLPPPVLQMLQAEKEQEGLPPEAIEIANQAKHELAKMAGQMQAMQEAMQAKEQECAQLAAQVKDGSADRQTQLQIAQMNNEAKMQLEQMKQQYDAAMERMKAMQEAHSQVMEPVVEREDQRDSQMAQAIMGMGQMLAQIMDGVTKSNQMVAQSIAMLAEQKSQPRSVAMQSPTGQIYTATIQ